MANLVLVHSSPDCLEIIRTRIGGSCILEEYDSDCESVSFAFKLRALDERVIADVIKYKDGMYAVTIDSVTTEALLPAAMKMLHDCKNVSLDNSIELKNLTRIAAQMP